MVAAAETGSADHTGKAADELLKELEAQQRTVAELQAQLKRLEQQRAELVGFLEERIGELEGKLASAEVGSRRRSFSF